MVRGDYLLIFIVLFFYSCSDSQQERISLKEMYSKSPSEWPAPLLDSGVVHNELAPLPEVVFPSENPYSKEKAELGKMLFFDPRLSSSGSIACASCHDPELGWGDGKRKSFGHERREGSRNAMTILNVAYHNQFFWDGRAATLEDQVRFPVEDEKEMNFMMSLMVERIQDIDGYTPLFVEAFGSSEINAEKIKSAIATFERTITSKKSRFDRFLEGDTSALSEEEVLGLHIFRTKGRCMNCHNGPLFTDFEFHNLGQSHLGRPSEDLGRYNITNMIGDVGKFKTPSLRDVAYTAPYMHHGLVIDLDEILNMYNEGMPQVIPKKEKNNPLYPHKSPHLQPLNLTNDEKVALKAFLHSISTRPQRIASPQLPE